MSDVKESKVVTEEQNSIVEAEANEATQVTMEPKANTADKTKLQYEQLRSVAQGLFQENTQLKEELFKIKNDISLRKVEFLFQLFNTQIIVNKAPQLIQKAITELDEMLFMEEDKPDQVDEIANELLG